MSAAPAGTYIWTDLLPGDDQGRAIAFYRDLFGWSGEAGPAEFGGYAMVHLGEPSPQTAVAGINARMGSEAPPQWTVYLATDDVAATIERISAHGGTLAFGPHDIPGMGKTAYCVDPTGAGFGLWEAGPFPGFGIASGEVGSFCWAELSSVDASASRDFFAAILGLEARPLSETDDFTYYQLAIPSNPEGRQIQFGIMQITDGHQFEPGQPSSFGSYVSVGDADAAVARAVELGGTAVGPVMDTPFGRMGGIRDPDGAALTLIDLSKATGG